MLALVQTVKTLPRFILYKHEILRGEVGTIDRPLARIYNKDGKITLTVFQMGTKFTDFSVESIHGSRDTPEELFVIIRNPFVKTFKRVVIFFVRENL